MLSGRLTRLASVAPSLLVATVSLASCGGGPIEENVVRPGITAMDESRELACGADATALRTAMDAYEMLEGEPTPDEAALVAEGYLRAESELWDVRDGAIVPADPDCGTVPADVPTTEMVTEGDPTNDLAEELSTMSPDDFLETVSEQEIADVGGRDCALEVAAVSIAYGRWTLDRGAAPTSLQALIDDGYLTEPLTRWNISDTAMEPVADSGCLGPIDLIAG